MTDFETRYTEFKAKFNYLSHKTGIPAACLVIVDHETSEGRVFGDEQIAKILTKTVKMKGEG